jgi:GT2 family glycosyltransferase
MKVSDVDISAVILSWNGRQYLETCLMSLEQAKGDCCLEVIVVDNASSDGSAEMVRCKFPGVKLIQNQENLGFAGGNNIGIKASSGRYVCLINSDIKLLKGCLQGLLNYMEQNPNIGILGPKILNADLTHQSSCRSFPGLWNNFCSAVGLASAFTQVRVFSGEHMFYFQGDSVVDVDVLVGCFWFVRREAMNQFGLLDEDFFMYAEDVDWCKRCWRTGWRVVFFPGAQVIHYWGGSSIKQDPVWVALTQQRSILHYWEKHHGVVARLGISCVLFLHKLIRLTGASITSARWLNPEQRIDCRTRVRVITACLKDFFSNQEVRSA